MGSILLNIDMKTKFKSRLRGICALEADENR